MVKTAIVPQIEAGEYVEPEKVNPYADAIADLEKRSETNENASTTITVDANAALKEQIKFQKAANVVGKTARLRNTDDSGAKVTGKNEKGKPIFEGVVKMTFTLTGKHKARRGKGE